MKYTILSFKTDDETKAFLQEVAKNKDMSVSAVIREAIKLYKETNDKNG